MYKVGDKVYFKFSKYRKPIKGVIREIEGNRCHIDGGNFVYTIDIGSIEGKTYDQD